MDDFPVYYNKHYVRTDERSRVIDGWSDGPHPEKDTEDAQCINEQGGYQFRLILDGEPTDENPPLFTMEGIPLYACAEGVVARRAECDIQADIAEIPPPPPSELEQLRADVDFLSIMQGVEL